MREWAGIQSVPRVITLDPISSGRVRFNPIAQVQSLRSSTKVSTMTARSLPASSATTVGGKASVSFEQSKR